MATSGLPPYFRFGEDQSHTLEEVSALGKTRTSCDVLSKTLGIFEKEERRQESVHFFINESRYTKT